METVFIVLLAVGIPVAGVVAVIVLPTFFRERTKQSAHKLISDALDKGEKIDPALITRLSNPPTPEPDRPRRTLGSAVILIALAIAMGASAFFSNDMTGSRFWDSGQFTAAAILGCLGVAFLVLAIVDYSGKKNQTPDA